MTKGVTLFEDEAEELTKVLAKRYGLIKSGRSFGELTSSPKGRMYTEPAGQDDFTGAAPAAVAASMPGADTGPEFQEAAACVAESPAQMDAAAPATA